MLSFGCRVQLQGVVIFPLFQDYLQTVNSPAKTKITLRIDGAWRFPFFFQFTVRFLKKSYLLFSSIGFMHSHAKSLHLAVDNLQWTRFSCCLLLLFHANLFCAHFLLGSHLASSILSCISRDMHKHRRTLLDVMYDPFFSEFHAFLVDKQQKEEAFLYCLWLIYSSTYAHGWQWKNLESTILSK